MRKRLEQLAHAHGFHHFRATTLGPTPRIDRFDSWLGRAFHGELAWLSRGRDTRADPRSRLPGGKSVLVLGLDHHHLRPPDPGGLTGMVARYAWGRDYHNLMGKRLKRFQKRLREEGIESWGGVDTAPILERAWASAAGLGFGGKNCVQILPARGSWIFLAVVFVDVQVEEDPPVGDHCGSCTRCLVACPTQAFVGDRVLDSKRCVAYWTIEDRGVIPSDLREGFGRWVFGCDVCQEVCPHNAAPPVPEEDDLLPRHAWLELDWLLEASDETILETFIGTPLRRPGAEALRRNACVVLGNLGEDGAIPLLRRAAEGPSALVAEHARWALGRLGG